MVGGRGICLGGETGDGPDPMGPIGGRPVLGWWLQEVSRFGITDAVLLVGPEAGLVEAALPQLRAALPRRMEIVLSRQPAGGGTGGALQRAAPLLQERFLVLDGGSLFDASLATVLAEPVGGAVLGRMLLRPVPAGRRAVTLDGDRVTFLRVEPNPTMAGDPGLVDAGVYVFDRRILDHLSEDCSLAEGILPRLAQDGSLRGIRSEGWFVDVGRPADPARVPAEWSRRLTRPALFLDRDGVCNVDHGWVGTQDRFEWIEGAPQAIASATRQGFHVFIVTNQSGVARGHYSEDQVRTLMDWMQAEVMRFGGTIDDYRYCPFHPQAPLEAYRRVSDWRKPAPGMILDLIRSWSLAPDRCLMIGDQATDLVAAAAAGIAGHLFPGGNLADFLQPLLSARSMA